MAAGALLTLALTGHLLWMVTAVFVVGVLVGRAWATWLLWAHALRDKWHLSRRATIPAGGGIVPVYDPARAPIPFGDDAA